MGGDTDGSERSWQEIAALCRSGNQKAVLEGNVLQWCSVKYLKQRYVFDGKRHRSVYSIFTSK